MELTLVYRGDLRPQARRGNVGIRNEKHHIRAEFHKQLKELWKRAPFEPEPANFYRAVGDFNFLPLVVEGRREVAEVNIIMLRPAAPGLIVGSGGDIDNRIKTLLDCLRMPKNNQELPEGITPKKGQKPFYCLLEDDKLITKLSVSTDRLLIPNKNSLFVHLLINVKVKQLGQEFGHMIIQ